MAIPPNRTRMNDKISDKVHVGGTRANPFRMPLRSCGSTHTHTQPSCIVSRGPRHNLCSHRQLQSQCLSGTQIFRLLFLLYVYIYVYIYIPSSPRFSEKHATQFFPSFKCCAFKPARKANTKIKKKKWGQPVRANFRSYKVLSTHRLVHQKQHVLRTRTPGKTKTNVNVATAHKCASQMGAQRNVTRTRFRRVSKKKEDSETKRKAPEGSGEKRSCKIQAHRQTKCSGRAPTHTHKYTLLLKGDAVAILEKKQATLARLC